MRYHHPTDRVCNFIFDETIIPRNGDRANIVVTFTGHEFRTNQNRIIHALELKNISHVQITLRSRISINEPFESTCRRYFISASNYNFASNCHGWTFFNGDYRLEKKSFIKTILLDEFDLIDKEEIYEENDVIIYLDNDSGNHIKNSSSLDKDSIIHSCKVLNGKFSHKYGDHNGEIIKTDVMDCRETYKNIGSFLLYRKKKPAVR